MKFMLFAIAGLFSFNASAQASPACSDTQAVMNAKSYLSIFAPAGSPPYDFKFSVQADPHGNFEHMVLATFKSAAGEEMAAMIAIGGGCAIMALHSVVGAVTP